jgi:hypothetical protein
MCGYKCTAVPEACIDDAALALPSLDELHKVLQQQHRQGSRQLRDSKYQAAGEVKAFAQRLQALH